MFTFAWYFGLPSVQHGLMETTQVPQSDSNPTGLFQYFGNKKKINCFNFCVSSFGSSGKSLQPTTVHLLSMVLSKKHSLASLTASVQIFLSVFSFLYFSTMMFGATRFSSLISEEGKRFVFGVCFKHSEASGGGDSDGPGRFGGM